MNTPALSLLLACLRPCLPARWCFRDNQGSDHCIALGADGTIYSWGSTGNGCLGRAVRPGAAGSTAPPDVVPMPDGAGKVVFIDCEHRYNAAVTENGELFTWGLNDHGQLGIGDKEPRATPTRVPMPADEAPVGTVSCGSTYAAAVTRAGKVLTWGHGGHGNLGHGDRRSRRKPKRVEGALGDEVVVQAACTRGQVGCKGGMSPRQGGAEGPHTCVITATGRLFTFGTCHKGLLLNFGNKTGGFNTPHDELVPYRVGDRVRNGDDKRPMSRWSVWPPPYDTMGRVTFVVSAHIHAAVIAAEGSAYAWGCGSNDGRCGVERFLNGSGDGKPPKVDHMKCYLMNPHSIGFADKRYWKSGSTLDGISMVSLATGRNHMLGIGSRRVSK